jgi:anti-sigma regulatory factor (Ser/Thr protein kinase)
MLLDRRSEGDVELLVLRGRIGEADASALGAAVCDALHATARGVVIDLTDADGVDGGAVEAMSAAAYRAGQWPEPPVAVCGMPAHLRDTLGPQLPVHGDRRLALADLEDRRSGSERALVVDAGPLGPRQARAALLAWAADLDLGPLEDDLLLVVSELVTNAVRYGKPPVCLAVSADERTVTVGVTDAGNVRPVRRAADDDAESGRGLLLLSLLSTQHGVRTDPPGKLVWARLDRS